MVSNVYLTNNPSDLQGDELNVEVNLDGIQLFHRNDDHYISH